MSKLPDSSYADKYSEEGFFSFVKKFGKTLSSEALILLFKLWFVLSDGKASPKTIALILAALGYAVSPIDLIPDVIPVIGLSDDAAVLAATAAAVASDITPEISKKAEQKVADIIG